MPVRFRLSIAYDGTDFHGWGVQPELRTVQGVLEAAIAKVLTRLGEKPRLVVAGRTDTGVHATGQVAHCDLSDDAVALLQQQSQRRSPVSVERAIPDTADAAVAAAAQLTHRLRGALSASPDVVVTEVVVAPEGFDARFSALWRRYEYRIADAVKVRDPLQRARTLWWGSTLDVEAMDTAAMSFLGLHDFAAFCRPRVGATTIRTMLEFRWHRDDDGTVVGSLRADAFCHSMVRSMVGASIEVGTGQLDGDDVTRILGETSRSAEFKVMAAKGLTLLEVAYPDDHALAARAELTRGLRVRS